MRRIPIAPRPDWLRTVEGQGLSYAVDRTGAGGTYWNESAYYEFTEPEIDALEATTKHLHQLVLEAVPRMLDDASLMSRLRLPEGAVELLRQSWVDQDEFSLYGRFDLAWGGLGTGEPKLLEYNADTPTALLEASVVQWMWLEDRFPDRDQWNMLHERLVQRWQELRSRGVRRVHFAVGQEEPTEDWATAAYLQDTAAEAGLEGRFLTMEDIGWHSERLAFVDLDEEIISHCYKIYPTEWLLEADFGGYLLDGSSMTRWIEPAWKLVAASKALLPVLWEMFPNHPNLLPAHFDHANGMTSYAIKPIYGWEGDGIQIVSPDGVESRLDTLTAGQPVVYQQYVALPRLDGNRPVLGTWMIGDHCAGLGVRESSTLITDTQSRFVPHVMLAPRSSPEQVAAWLSDP